MNWYKKAQEIIDKPWQQGIHYCNIGHGWHDRGSEERNIIWILRDGRIEEVEESSEFLTHDISFDLPPDEQEKFYSGRYEPADDRLSITIPLNQEMQRIRQEVPNPILRQLLNRFPNTKGVYIF